MSRNKLLTSAIALGTAAALTLGGTFAWQSISQTGTLEASNVVNPGGRLHDDFDGENKDVYVENFDEDDIFARVRLEEFFEIVMNANTPAEKSIPMIGTKERAKDEDGNELKTENDNPIYNYTYEVFTNYKAIQEDGTVAAGLVKDEGAGDEDPAHSWWTWTLGGKTVFMPTFNKNKDSLRADINGKYLFDTGVLSSKDDDQYSEMKEYTDGQKETKFSINDIDSNQIDELEKLSDEDFDKIIETGTVPDIYNKNVKTKSEEHFAKSTAEAKLISMEEWLNMVKTEETDDEGNTVYNYDETTHGNYWVYDEDGWVYWSAPIHGGEATGLLLNGIELAETMDNSWYYGLNVVGQFCTAGDLGEPGVENDDGSTTAGTGFYADGGEVSTEALTLLDIIGVNDTWSEGDEHPAEGGDEDENTATVLHIYDYTERLYNPVSVTDTSKNQFILCKGATNEHFRADCIIISYSGTLGDDLTEDTDYTYDQDTGLLTILLEDGDSRLNSFGTELYVNTEDPDDGFHGNLEIIWNDDKMLTPTAKSNDATIAKIGQAVKVQDTDGQLISIEVQAYNGSTWETIAAEGNYTYAADTGMLTITNDTYVNGEVLVYQDGSSSYAVLYLTDDDDDSSAEGDGTIEVALTGYGFEEYSNHTGTVGRMSAAFEQPYRLTGDGETLDGLTISMLDLFNTNSYGTPDCVGEQLTAEEYTYENGVLTFHESDRLSAGHYSVWMQFAKIPEDGEDYDSYIFYDMQFLMGGDATLSLKAAPNDDDDVSITPIAYAALNEAVTLTMPDGSHPGNVEGTDKVVLVYAYDGYTVLGDDCWSYDPSTGALTISDNKGYSYISVCIQSKEQTYTYLADYSGIVMIKGT